MSEVNVVVDIVEATPELKSELKLPSLYLSSLSSYLVVKFSLSNPVLEYSEL